MSCGVDRRGGVIGRYNARKVGFVVRTAIEGGVNWYLLFGNDDDLDLRRASLASSTRTTTEDS